MFGRKNKRKEKDKGKSKKQDIVDEGDSEALRLLRANISNYYGYKNKEVRQSSDIAFREHLLEILRNASDGMSKVHELLIHSQLITTWGLVGEIKKKLEKLRREVANTDYHKSTFFDIDDVEGPNGIDLSILYLLEIEILDIAVDLKERVAKANTNLEPSNGGIGNKLKIPKIKFTHKSANNGYCNNAILNPSSSLKSLVGGIPKPGNK